MFSCLVNLEDRNDNNSALRFLWFALAIFIEVFGNLAFLFFLKTLGIKPSIILYGIPGYLEYAYWKWCKNQRRSPERILVLRGVSFANLILAAIVVIPMIISANGK